MHNGVRDFLLDNDLSGFSFSEDSEGPERAIEIGGRVCYMSFSNPRPGGNKEYIKHIIESGHGSCLEHAVFMLLITGVSRILTHELVRHRVGVSPSQLSQRYVDGGTRGMVVRPGINRMIEEAIKVRDIHEGKIDFPLSEVDQPLASCGEAMIEHFINSESVYRKIQKARLSQGATRKQANEDARSALCENSETVISITANARSIRHMLELRGNNSADSEFQRLSVAILGAVSRVAPSIFFDVSVVDGFVVSNNRKV